MDYTLHAESGCQLLARLAPRPSLIGLDYHVLALKPNEQTIIEVSGEPATGKTLLLLTWAAKALLPRCYDGLGAGVLLFDTDMHISVLTLCKLLEALLTKHSKHLTADIKNAAVKKALEQLTVINICDGMELKASLLTLDKLLLNAPHISLVLLDSLPAFYWSDRLSGGECHKDKYQQKILALIHQKTYHHKIVLAFTRTSDFQSRSGSSTRQCPGVNIQIGLKQLEDKFSAFVTSGSGHKVCPYRLTDEGVIWTKEIS